MNKREKILGICVGLLALVAVLNVGTKRVIRLFSTRSDKIAELRESIDSKEVMKHRGKKARQLLDQYDTRSLPSDPVIANSRYRAWLHDWVEGARIRDANVKHVVWRKYRDSHDRHTFSVTCHADLPQLVELLFNFYSVDYLHRIKHMSAKPLEDKVLSLGFTIEAISMPDVPADFELAELPAERLAFNDLTDYVSVIVGRNLYSPANQPPKFAASESEQGYVNQRMSFSPKFRDPENGKVRYRVEANGLEGLSIDEESGEIEWTPDQTGDFEILVFAVDDGLPAKQSSQAITLAVSEPPPPREEAPSKPSFDEAKYTFVTGIVEKNGHREVWLTVRTDGTWLRLQEGEDFQVGDFDGKVVRIHPRHVEIETSNSLLSVRYGQSISEGEVLRGDKEDVASRAD